MSRHRITFVRHGETSGESSIRYHGINDVPLSPSGEEQMRRVGNALSHMRFDRVFSSELQRSRAAARIVSDDVYPMAVPDLNEINFGRWEGLTRQEIAERDPELYKQWRAEPGRFSFPEGDDRIAFDKRVVDGLSRVLTDHPSGEWLMVLHRGVIAAALGSILGPAACESLDIALGSIHIVSRDGNAWLPEKLDLLP